MSSNHKNVCPTATCNGGDSCIFNHASAGIAVINEHGMYMWANQRFCDMFGYARKEIIGEEISLILPEDARDMARLYYEHLGQYGVKESVEWKLRRKNGTLFDAEVNTSVLHDANGRNVAISLFNDITRRKRIEHELNEKEQYNRLLFQESPVGISLTDKSGRFRQMNGQYLKMVGYSADELHGMCYQDLSAPEYEEKDRIRRKELNLTGRIENYQKELIRKDGTRLPVTLNVVRIELNGEESYLCSAVDVSAIIQARRQAEAANQAKDAFLSNMSHEMRTPLNGIMGVAQLVSQGELNAAQRSLLDTMFHCGEALESMIDDLLDLSSLYTGVLKLKSESFNLEDALNRLVHLFRPEAEDKGLDLIIHYPADGPVHFIGDGGRIRQMLAHLVGNALKFTSAGYVSVEISFDNIEQESIWTRIRVTDSGIGMSEEQQSLLNSVLSQADMLPTRRQGGIGLGLSLCRELTRTMGGALYMDSRPDEGTEFTITLPLQADPLAPSRQIRETPWRAKPMLIVSASPHMRHMLSELARRWQFHADMCHTGEEVIDLLKQADAMERPYWLVLADSRITDMPIGTLINEITAMGGAPARSLAVICGPREIEEVHAPHEHEIGAFMVRPISPSSLYDALLSLWQSREAEVSAADSVKEETAASLITQKGRRRPHVLIVEDNAANQLVAQGFLEHLQCRWDIADNGADAVRKIERNHYDLVLMDIQMPGMDGFEATHAIRALEAGEQIPIIAMTANALRDDREQCIAAGMNDYVSKPVHLDALQTMLEKYCAHVIDAIQSAHGEPRVLLLESDASLRQKMTTSLREERPGITIMEAGDAVEGCVRIGSFAPSVIIFDPDMPGLDSETLVRFLLRIPRYARTMLIAWTTSATTLNKTDYMRRQGVQVLPCKPEIDAVLAVIRGDALPCESSHETPQDDAPLSPKDGTGIKEPLLFSPEIALSVTGGNIELLKRIVSLIAEDLPRQMSLLKEALQTSDAKSARLAAHSVKGQAANMGAQSLREIAYHAEQAAADGNLEAVAALVSDIEIESAMLIEQLLNMNWG